MPRLILFAFFTCFIISARAQSPLWAFNIGGATDDYSHVVKVAPNGNVYIAGKFTGTMDLDPGPGIYNITSNGLDDIFLACYTSAGTFLWGFGIGGPSYDAVWQMNVDLNSNVIITGWIQSGGIDFDPGAGVTILPYVGGTGLTYYGDAFIAKYSSTGAFMWADDIGGTTVYDHGENITTDQNGNVYLSGEADDMVTIGSYTYSSGATGQAFFVKYSPSGSVIWAHNFGLPGTTSSDCQIWGLRYSNGFLYMSGTFQGTSNFDPWGAPEILTSVGYYDAYIAKYDTNGNFVFVDAVVGAGSPDEALALELDGSDNMYITGYTYSPSMTFDPASPGTSTVVSPGGGGNADIFMAKYNSSGAYQWGTVLGGPGNDYGWALDIFGGFLYATGEFHNVVDMDPSAAVANLTSTGGYDIYVTKYDLNGNYICGFSLGNAATDDAGYGLSHDAAGNLYLTGQFGSTVDFDPTAGSYPLTSHGGTDAFLVKYSLSGGIVYTGSMTGDTICSGQSAQITVFVTGGGPGPYDIVFSDGTSSFTQTGVISGVPFTLSPSPTVTTTYTMITISGAGTGLCTAPSGAGFGSATVLVHPTPVVTISDVHLSCSQVLFSASAGDSIYDWNFGDGTMGAGNPVMHTYSVTGTEVISLTQTSKFNCVGSGSLSVPVTAPPVVDIGPDTTLCSGNSLTLQSTIGYTSPTYIWSTGSTAPFITVSTSGTYWLKVTDGGCSGTDTINVTFKPSPIVSLGNDTGFCSGNTLVVRSIQPPGSAMLWSTGSTADSINISASGTYWLRVTNSIGCATTDTIHINVSPSPAVDLGPDTSQCQGLPVTLQSLYTYSSATYSWSTGATTPSITVPFSGTYWLAVTIGGCPGSDTVNVLVVDDTFSLANRDTAVCLHQPVPVSVSVDPSATVQWLPTAGIAVSTVPSTTIWPDTSAMYYVFVRVPGCPVLEDSFYVDVQPNPIVFAGGNRSVCQYDSVHLVATVTPAWYTHYIYSWSPSTYISDTTQPAVVFTAGADTKYFLTVKTPKGCSSEDSATITVHPGDFLQMEANFNVCPHDSVHFIPSGAVSYQWHPGLYLSDSTSIAPWVYPITSQNYTLIATSAFGCLDTANVSVIVHPAAVIYIKDSVELFPGESYHIQPQSNCVYFEWFPPAGLDYYTIADPVATPQISTEYKVFAATEWGCKVIDSIGIYLEGSLLAIPNAFSPGSSTNNKLTIIVQGEATLSYFRIYNRWGNKVFETNNIADGWDGTYNGKPQPFDVYVYVIEATTIEGKVLHKSGNVTLIR